MVEPTKPKPAAAKPTPAAAKPTPGATKPTTTVAKTAGGKTIDDYECPICLEFCTQPVITPCKHFFCHKCSKAVQNMGMTCPLCRRQFDKFFVPKVDKELQAEIEKAFSPEYLARKEELILAGEWAIDLKSVLFSIGNTHEDVKNPKPANSNKEVKNSHRWTMYVSMANGNAEESNAYIKSVTYHLHPTFKPAVVKVTQAPFLIARVGWGYFDIKVVVEYHPQYKLKNETFEHELNFNQPNTCRNVVVEVSPEVEAKMKTGLGAAEVQKKMAAMKI